MSSIFLDGETVHYEVLGHGKPVIFLHSWVGSLRYWIPSMQFASKRYQAFASDFWGYGATKKVADRYSLKDQFILLDELIQYMGMRDITLVGHGLGGIIAIYYSAEYPESVERTMVISFPMGIENTSPRLRYISPSEAAKWLFGPRSTNTESREDATKADPHATIDSLFEFSQVNWRQLINRIPIPSLWIHGQNDQAINLPTDEQLMFLPELALYQVFNDSGHFPMLDEPEKFNRLLSSFLKLNPGEDPNQLEFKPIWKRRVR
jgi:pimeloyl-ACP methyl ester carboxylesterase